METTGKKHTKTLDTLVPDINKLLTNLGDGKKLNVSDEQLNKFLKNIKDASQATRLVALPNECKIILDKPCSVNK